MQNKNENIWHDNTKGFISHYFFNYILKKEVESVQFRFVFNKKDPLKIIKNALLNIDQDLLCSLRIEITYKTEYSLPVLYKVVNVENIGRAEYAKQFVELCNMLTSLNKVGWTKLYTHPLSKFRPPYGHYIPHTGSEFKFNNDMFRYNDILISSIAKLSEKEFRVVDVLLINNILKELVNDIACKIENNVELFMLEDINIEALTGINSVDNLFDLLCLYNGLSTAENSYRLRVVRFDNNNKIQISIRDLDMLREMIELCTISKHSFSPAQN